MSARILAILLSVAVSSCNASSRVSEQPRARNHVAAEAEASEEQANPEYLDCEPPLACSMAGYACPSSTLPRLRDQLDAAGWAELRALAAERVVAIDLASAEVALVESCRVPGRYLEAAAAPDSPGRAWSSDRLVFVPEELHDCTGATHFVAAFAVREDQFGGDAIVLPLPCPELGSGVPDHCIGSGLDDDARLQLVRERWQRIQAWLPCSDEQCLEQALSLLVEVAALQPNAINYVNVAKHLGQMDEYYGACLWLSEASFAARAFDPSFESRIDLAQGRIAPSHEQLDCYSRPSLLTCFPEHFVPGVGDNCW